MYVRSPPLAKLQVYWWVPAEKFFTVIQTQVACELQPIWIDFTTGVGVGGLGVGVGGFGVAVGLGVGVAVGFDLGGATDPPDPPDPDCVYGV